MQYEINFLILQSNTENLDKIRTEVKNLIEKTAGKITDQLFYQKRKLAYEIRKERYGFYSVFRFEVDGKPEALKELKSELNLNHSVARYLIVKADDLPALEKRELQEDTSAEQPVTAQADPKTTPAKKTSKSDELEKEVISKSTVPTETSPKQEEEKIVEEEKESSIEEEVVATLGDKEDKKSEEVEEKSTSPKVKKEEKPSSSPEQTTESEKEEVKRRPTKKQASLEDLDKKLDEILDI
ncbi:MAG TPA: 30S ribosomal protein S6 [Candidatus Moranbacteria bacterium]|nr:30S ribosomal protein S6 [Candidatus Moranbacteria bacterium]